MILALGTGPAVVAEEVAPEWRPFSEPSVGLALEVDADFSVSYMVHTNGVPVVFVGEIPRNDPTLAEGKSSMFEFNTDEFRTGLGADLVPGYLHTFAIDHQAELMGELGAPKIVKDEAFVFQGLPARELIMSGEVAEAGKRATMRTVYVARGKRYYIFTWTWMEAGPTPADSQRIYNSIRITEPKPDPNGKSRGMLEHTIAVYWLTDDYPTKLFMAPALRKIADPKRVTESKMIHGFGGVVRAKFQDKKDGYRVFRIEHTKAIVDWYVADDGHQITGLTWKKISDINREF